MYCPNCGTQTANDARFCGKCGRDLGAASAQGSPESSQSYPLPGRESVPNIPNYLVQAILVTILCCMPTGIVSIVYAAQVNGKIQAGDIDGAIRTSKAAKSWAWVSFGLGVVYVLFVVAYIIIALASIETGE